MLHDAKRFVPVRNGAPLLALAVCVSALIVTFGRPPLRRSTEPAGSRGRLQTRDKRVEPALPVQRSAERGRQLFDRNCAHCHGDDARGDEGPSLYNLALSDTRIAKKIKEGIKGEMPRFGSKFNEAEIAALTAYLRTLKE